MRFFCSRSRRRLFPNELWAAVFLLVALAFGGGILLARFPFDSNEHTASVRRAHPREFLYQRPVDTRRPEARRLFGSEAAGAEAVPNDVSDPHLRQPESPEAREDGISEVAEVFSSLAATSATKGDERDERRDSFVLASGANGGLHMQGLPIADAAPQGSYEALETAVVPEPGTTALLALAAATFLGAACRKRR